MSEFLRIKGARPRIIHVKNEPIKDLPFDDFWKSWDRLMDREMFMEANIFLQQRYNNGWNRGLLP